MTLHTDTPLLESRQLSLSSERSVWLKLEALQPPGSFKSLLVGQHIQTHFEDGGNMKINLRVLLVVAACVSYSCVTFAAGDLTQQTPIDVEVQLGDDKNALRFMPDTIELETGKLYRLILSNPSAQKHYFSSEGLSQAVFSRKVQVNDAEGKALAEVKGVIREIEVYPNAITEWWVVPVKTGHFGDLKCTIPGHAEAGMVGHIVIK
jgi:uncharacterized cupredoxin-like copper-binding protein